MTERLSLVPFFTRTLSSRNERLAILSLYILLAAIHFAMSQLIHFPVLFYDEAYYLSEARYFSHTGPTLNLAGGAYGEFGYALTLIPAFLYSSGAILGAWPLVMITNCLLLSSMLPLIYFIIRRILNLEKRLALLIASVISLFPPYLLFSSDSISENAFVPCFLLSVLALINFVAQPRSLVAAILFGLCGPLLYMVHGPGLVELVAIAVVTLILFVSRVTSAACAFVVLLSLLLPWQLVRKVDSHLMLVGWHETSMNYVSSITGMLLAPSGILIFLKCIVQETFGISVGTLGLFGVGIAFCVFSLIGVVRSRQLSVFEAVCIYALLSTVGTLFLGSAQLASNAFDTPASGGLDLYVATRYLEPVIPIMLLLALQAMGRAVFSTNDIVGLRPAIIYSLGIMFIATIMSLPSIASYTDSLQGAEIHWSIGSLVWIPRILHIENLYPAVVIGFAGLLIFWWVAVKRSASLAVSTLCMLGAVWLCGGIATFAHDNLPTQWRYAENTDSPVRLNRFIAPFAAIAPVNYDMSRATFQRFYYATYQLLNPTYAFAQFDSSKGQMPNGAAAISNATWANGNRAYKRVACEELADQCLWVSGITDEQINKMFDYDTAADLGIGVDFGSRAVAGVDAYGIYAQDGTTDHPYRWTNGDARLVVPRFRLSAPRDLEIAFYAPTPGAVDIRIDGSSVLQNLISPGMFSATIPISRSQYSNPLLLEIITPQKVFLPDTRTLGVELTKLEFTDSAAAKVAPSPVDPRIVASGIYATEGSGPDLFAWTNGNASFSIPHLAHATVAITLVGPTQIPQMHLHILANARILYQGVSKPGLWQRSFDLSKVPGSGHINLEIKSDTFRPPGDKRTLGMQLHGLSLK